MNDLKMTNAGDYMSESDFNEEAKWKPGSTNLHVSSDSKMLEPHWVLRIPKYAGCWVIGGNFHIQIPQDKKPTPEQIKNTEQMFGWEWKDNDG